MSLDEHFSGFRERLARAAAKARENKVYAEITAKPALGLIEDPAHTGYGVRWKLVRVVCAGCGHELREDQLRSDPCPYCFLPKSAFELRSSQ